MINLKYIYFSISYPTNAHFHPSNEVMPGRELFIHLFCLMILHTVYVSTLILYIHILTLNEPINDRASSNFESKHESILPRHVFHSMVQGSCLVIRRKKGILHVINWNMNRIKYVLED